MEDVRYYPNAEMYAGTGLSLPRRRAANDWLDRSVKRGFDLVCSLLGLVASLPLFLIVYIAIWLDDRHNPIFKQQRIGYKGKPFTIYKFRSMRITSEQDGRPQLCHGDDSRLTRVGRFIRAHHLDEMPQLWNVLVGDMSFVGPRPERKFFIDQIMAIDPSYQQLYALRPGLFSEATLYNGYTDTMAKMIKRLRLDLRYLYNRTFWLDLKIIYLTMQSILLGKKF